MNRGLNLALLGSLLVLAHCRASAQTNSGFWVQTVSVTLTAYVQASGSTNINAAPSKIAPIHVGNKEILASFGGATASSFSSAAKLLFKQPFDPEATPSFIVRDRSPAPEVDVTQFIALEQNFPVVVTRTNARAGTTSSTAYGTLNVGFSTPQTSFGVGGFAKALSTSLVENGTVIQPGVTRQLTANVSGLGSVLAGVPAAFRGTITLNDGKRE